MEPFAVAAIVAALAASASHIAPIGWGGALTLPAQRHAIRIEPPGRAPYLLVAVQQHVRGEGGLNFHRSDDGGKTWRFEAAIQPDPSEMDRADLVQVGQDVALVLSYEGPRISGSTRHDVLFQWWEMDATTGRLVPRPPVGVFDSRSPATAYHRAELAVDSVGRIWVHAFKLEADGRFTAAIAVSTDGGATFAEQPALDVLSTRGGGRLAAAGGKVVLLYDGYDPRSPGRMRVREDSWPLWRWGPVEVVMPEGIYHGAALSVAPDGKGGLHVVTKSKTEALWYRHFDGARFSAPLEVTGPGDWALQPATTRVGDALVICYNRPAGGNYVLEGRTVSRGALSKPFRIGDGRATYKNYPSAIAELPVGSGDVPCFYSEQPDPRSNGTELVDFAPAPPRAAASAPPSVPSAAPGAAPPQGASPPSASGEPRSMPLEPQDREPAQPR